MKELTFSQFNRELNRMYKECNEFYHALAKHFGLSDSAFWILYTLREEGRPLSATDLGGALFLSKQTIHSGVRSLEERGLLKLRSSSEDKRNKEICLTEKGEAFSQESVDQVVAFEEKAFLDLGAGERLSRIQAERPYLDALWEAARPLFKREGPEGIWQR